mmetsp:Transcript_10095/g.29001  ORF Transcript_10095/g.29001 Transcript_10095/m.29001 type:complete len:260 (-) Transcript_10095:4-783(-)
MKHLMPYSGCMPTSTAFTPTPNLASESRWPTRTSSNSRSAASPVITSPGLLFRSTVLKISNRPSKPLKERPSSCILFLGGRSPRPRLPLMPPRKVRPSFSLLFVWKLKPLSESSCNFLCCGSPPLGSLGRTAMLAPRNGGGGAGLMSLPGLGAASCRSLPRLPPSPREPLPLLPPRRRLLSLLLRCLAGLSPAEQSGAQEEPTSGRPAGLSRHAGGVHNPVGRSPMIMPRSCSGAAAVAPSPHSCAGESSRRKLKAFDR